MFFSRGPFDFSIERTPNLNILASVKTLTQLGYPDLVMKTRVVSILSTTANIVYC